MTWWSWGENVLVWVEPRGPSSSVVNAESSLVLGLIDWGKNQSNLDKIFDAVDRQLRHML